jgi:hypothetical protein
MPSCAQKVAAKAELAGAVFGGIIGTFVEPVGGTVAGAELGAEIAGAIGFIVAASEASEVPTPSSAGKMQKEVERGLAPSSVERVDRGNPDDPGDREPHIHFKGEKQALKRDGTWKEGSGRPLTKRETKWVEKHNWTVPKSE